MTVVFAEPLRHAARWHDWGKAHAAFQGKLRDLAARDRALHGEPMAKAPKAEWHASRLPDKPPKDNPRRKYFRHELASALAVLHPDSAFPLGGEARDLAAFLIAAHHGKVRLSIRSLPGEWTPPNGQRFARGIWENDPLPAAHLGGTGTQCTHTAEIPLSLEPMELGLGAPGTPFTSLPSWAERMLSLRDAPHLGPFRLAFLETLLRAADQRASALAPSATEAEPSSHEPSGTNPAMAQSLGGGAVPATRRSGAGERLLEHVDGGRTGQPPVAEGSSLPAGATRARDASK